QGHVDCSECLERPGCLRLDLGNISVDKGVLQLDVRLKDRRKLVLKPVVYLELWRSGLHGVAGGRMMHVMSVVCSGAMIVLVAGAADHEGRRDRCKQKREEN